MKRFALMLSHLPYQCCGKDRPLQNLLESILYIKAQRGVLVTSCGALHWDLQLSAAVSAGIPVELIVPESASEFWNRENIKQEFGSVNMNLLLLVSGQDERDRIVYEKADEILPIWIRSRGRLKQIFSEINPDRVSYKFDCSQYRFPSPVKYQIDTSDIDQIPEGYLWHWTRSCCGKWREETIGQYCEQLLSHEHYPHSARCTLERIIYQKQIYASGDLICGNVPVVSFTENTPREMIPHFSWRQGRHRMNFEPYGIGIPRELLLSRGAEPVQYNGKPAWNAMVKGERWKDEKEWRLQGDLFLDDELKRSIVLFVPTEEESDLFREYPVFSFL